MYLCLCTLCVNEPEIWAFVQCHAVMCHQQYVQIVE